MKYSKPYARLTIDMHPEEHTCLKMASAQLNIAMREFILLSAFKQMTEIDDPWLVEKANEALIRFSNYKSEKNHKQQKTNK